MVTALLPQGLSSWIATRQFLPKSWFRLFRLYFVCHEKITSCFLSLMALPNWYLLLQARKTESSLQKIRLGAQKRAGASTEVTDNNVSDTDKMCMQLFLDIQVRIILSASFDNVVNKILSLFCSVNTNLVTLFPSSLLNIS